MAGANIGARSPQGPHKAPIGLGRARRSVAIMTTPSGENPAPEPVVAPTNGRARPRLVGTLALLPTVIVLVEHKAYWTFTRMMEDLDVGTLESAADNAAIREAQRHIVATTNAVTTTALVLAVVVTAFGWFTARRRYWVYPLLVAVAALVATWLLNAEAVDLIRSFRR